MLLLRHVLRRGIGNPDHLYDLRQPTRQFHRLRDFPAHDRLFLLLSRTLLAADPTLLQERKRRLTAARKARLRQYAGDQRSHAEFSSIDTPCDRSRQKNVLPVYVVNEDAAIQELPPRAMRGTSGRKFSTGLA